MDGVGGFEFQLSTTDADEGHYLVTASVNPSATARFTLDATAPVRPVEGSGPVVAVPGGIAYSAAIHLPFVDFDSVGDRLHPVTLWSCSHST